MYDIISELHSKLVKLHTIILVLIIDYFDHVTLRTVVTIMASLMALGGEVCLSALQSLELLVIDNDNLLQPILLDQMITMTIQHPLDKQSALLVGKILCCYANNEEVCTCKKNACLHAAN